ncbi:MAG: low molecular weight phosphotyrosine protein phosphatase [Spirochaetaceae bacterium]|nr:MAG: low molecular weight phosphotyrosine protein phosphatase [Spirochaetaceae bacterium]
MQPKSVMFVCQGNICRSPLAQALFENRLEKRGIARRYRVDSTGVSSYHAGESSDRRMRETAARRGVRVDHRARAVTRRDLEEFDLILAMDRDNYSILRRKAHGDEQRDKIRMFRDFDPISNGEIDVPDPWYGGIQGFEQVYGIVERTCEALIDHLEDQPPT